MPNFSTTQIESKYLLKLPEKTRNSSDGSHELQPHSQCKFNQATSLRFPVNLNEFSLGLMINNYETELPNNVFRSQSIENDQFYWEQSSCNIFSRGKGYSECYQQEFQRQNPLNVHLFYCPQDMHRAHAMQALQQQSNLHKQAIFPLLPIQVYEQEFISKNIPVQMTKSTRVKDIQHNTNSKQSSKNVTKNLGKLLFKFIWKHRNMLRHQVSVSEQEWQKFIQIIKKWKKQNNITRQYLLQKWNPKEEQSKLFRIVSRHFFRKRCLPALFACNISSKRPHLQRIFKFDAAIVDPSALSCLN